MTKGKWGGKFANPLHTIEVRGNLQIGFEDEESMDVVNGEFEEIFIVLLFAPKAQGLSPFPLKKKMIRTWEKMDAVFVRSRISTL